MGDTHRLRPHVSSRPPSSIGRSTVTTSRRRSGRRALGATNFVGPISAMRLNGRAPHERLHQAEQLDRTAAGGRGGRPVTSARARLPSAGDHGVEVAAADPARGEELLVLVGVAVARRYRRVAGPRRADAATGTRRSSSRAEGHVERRRPLEDVVDLVLGRRTIRGERGTRRRSRRHRAAADARVLVAGRVMGDEARLARP